MTACAGDWAFNLNPHIGHGQYSQSAKTRESIDGMGVFVDAQYRDRFGVTLGSAQSELKYKLGLPTLRQNGSFLSARWSFRPDALPGLLTLRGDAHHVNNTDATNETSQVRVFAPRISFLDHGGTRYVDLGYARSHYGDSRIGNNPLLVEQITPTAGFGFNEGADWIQLRLYDIRVSNPVRAQNRASTQALDVRLTHYLNPAGWAPEQLHLGILAGKRVFAVDGDSASVYNLADMQRGGISAGVQWRITPHAKLLLNVSHDRYESVIGGIDNPYSSTYLYAGMTAFW